MNLENQYYDWILKINAIFEVLRQYRGMTQQFDALMTSHSSGPASPFIPQASRPLFSIGSS